MFTILRKATNEKVEPVTPFVRMKQWLLRQTSSVCYIKNKIKAKKKNPDDKNIITMIQEYPAPTMSATKCLYSGLQLHDDVRLFFCIIFIVTKWCKDVMVFAAIAGSTKQWLVGKYFFHG